MIEFTLFSNHKSSVLGGNIIQPLRHFPLQSCWCFRPCLRWRNDEALCIVRRKFCRFFWLHSVSKELDVERHIGLALTCRRLSSSSLSPHVPHVLQQESRDTCASQQPTCCPGAERFKTLLPCLPTLLPPGPTQKYGVVTWLAKSCHYDTLHRCPASWQCGLASSSDGPA